MTDVASIARKRGRVLVAESVVSGKHIGEAVGEVVSLLRRDNGDLEDLEAAQFPNPFQLKRSINNIVARVYGHSPSTFEKLTAFPRELGLTKRGDQYLLVLRDT